MKVVVLGNLEKDMRRTGANFPNLDISYVTARNAAGSDQLLKHADRLVVMTRFVSHGLTAKTPREKTTLIHGGFSRLRDELERLNTVAPVLEQAADDTHPFTLEQEDDDMRISPYPLHQMLEAKAGDTVVFKKLPDQKVENFGAAIRQAMLRYKGSHGLEAEWAWAAGKQRIEVLITKAARRDDEPAAAELPAAVPSASAVEAPAMAHAPAPQTSTAVHQAYWWAVYLESLKARPSAFDDAHEKTANNALDAFLKRFPKE